MAEFKVHTVESKKPVGRGKGTKTKATIDKAIQTFEAYTVEAANFLTDVMLGRVEGAKVAQRMDAAKYIIGAPKSLRQGLVETQETIEKGVMSDAEQAIAEAEEDNKEVVPLVSLRIIDAKEEGKEDVSIEPI